MRFLKLRAKGASLIEFGLVVGLISVVSIGTVFTLGDKTRGIFCTVSETVKSSIFQSDPETCFTVADFDGGAGGGGQGGGEGSGNAPSDGGASGGSTPINPVSPSPPPSPLSLSSGFLTDGNGALILSGFERHNFFTFNLRNLLSGVSPSETLVWSYVNGGFPAGVTFDPIAGTLSGIPEHAGVSPSIISVTRASGEMLTISMSVIIAQTFIERTMSPRCLPVVGRECAALAGTNPINIVNIMCRHYYGSEASALSFTTISARWRERPFLLVAGFGSSSTTSSGDRIHIDTITCRAPPD